MRTDGHRLPALGSSEAIAEHWPAGSGCPSSTDVAWLQAEEDAIQRELRLLEQRLLSELQSGAPQPGSSALSRLTRREPVLPAAQAPLHFDSGLRTELAGGMSNGDLLASAIDEIDAEDSRRRRLAEVEKQQLEHQLASLDLDRQLDDM
eukprot:5474258-Amphidinium_carterae.2